jgi:hypothetical protein
MCAVSLSSCCSSVSLLQDFYLSFLLDADNILVWVFEAPLWINLPLLLLLLLRRPSFASTEMPCFIPCKRKFRTFSPSLCVFSPQGRYYLPKCMSIPWTLHEHCMIFPFPHLSVKGLQFCSSVELIDNAVTSVMSFYAMTVEESMRVWCSFRGLAECSDLP